MRAKNVVITVTLACHGDVPDEVVDWMAGNLIQHVKSEFGDEYDPEWHEGVYDKAPFARRPGCEGGVGSRRGAYDPIPRPVPPTSRTCASDGYSL